MKYNKTLYIPNSTGIFLTLLFMILCLSNYAQKPRQVEILNSDQLYFNKNIDEDLRRLVGNVELRHDSSYLYCDSAYFYRNANSFRAFGNVLLSRGDTLFLFGDSIHYNGNTSEGEVYNNVRLKDPGMMLKTDYLKFDLVNNKSIYEGGGQVIDSINNLTSEIGIYFSDTHIVYFKNNVVLTNPDYTVVSDTLMYDTNLEISYFFGPTEINSDSVYIYCENGWYDSNKGISQYGKNTIIRKSENTIFADSIRYNRINGKGIARFNVVISDTIQKIILKGNYSSFDQVSGNSFITDSAVFIQYDGRDSLFMHSDTLFSSTDSSGKGKLVRAWYHVKFFKYELQGKCDSLSFSSTDSLIKLFGSPVLWNEKNQLTAEFIQIHNSGKNADRIDMKNSAFMISMEDSAKYNQIAGKEMTGYIRNNEIYKIIVDGNAQSIYFPKDGDNFIGANKSLSSNMSDLAGRVPMKTE